MNNLLLAGSPVWLIIKLAVLLLLVFYIIYAAVIVRQVKLMIDTLHVGYESFVRVAVWAHLILAIVVFFIAILV